MTGSLTERYDDRIAGVLSCYDRVVVTGTLPTVCYAAGMTKFLYAIGVRIFDYPQFASTLRDRVRERAASLAAQAGITIEHIAKSHIRKEAVVAEVLKRRGEHPGLVHVISAMEACGAYQPRHDKQTHKTFVRPDSGKFRSVGTLRPLYQTSRPRVGAERQGGADRQLSRPSDQPATGPGDRFSVFHSHRGDLHQTPLRQFLDQDVRQARLRAPH